MIIWEFLYKINDKIDDQKGKKIEGAQAFNGPWNNLLKRIGPRY